VIAMTDPVSPGLWHRHWASVHDLLGEGGEVSIVFLGRGHVVIRVAVGGRRLVVCLRAGGSGIPSFSSSDPESRWVGEGGGGGQGYLVTSERVASLTNLRLGGVRIEFARRRRDRSRLPIRRDAAPSDVA